MTLTEEQKAKIQENRRKALALRALKQQQAAQAQAQASSSSEALQELLNEGGFTREADEEGGDAGSEAQPTGTASGAAAAPAGPARVALAPTIPEGGGCEVCGSSMLDEGFFKVFGISVCYPCKSANEEEYGLVSKGEAAAEFCLQDGTIKVMPCMERRNPRHAKFQAMKLYCRRQLRAKAHERWGGPEELEEERERRRKRKYEMALSKMVEEDVFAKKKAKP